MSKRYRVLISDVTITNLSKGTSVCLRCLTDMLLHFNSDGEQSIDITIANEFEKLSNFLNKQDIYQIKDNFLRADDFYAKNIEEEDIEYLPMRLEDYMCYSDDGSDKLRMIFSTKRISNEEMEKLDENNRKF